MHQVAPLIALCAEDCNAISNACNNSCVDQICLILFTRGRISSKVIAPSRKSVQRMRDNLPTENIQTTNKRPALKQVTSSSDSKIEAKWRKIRTLPNSKTIVTAENKLLAGVRPNGNSDNHLFLFSQNPLLRPNSSCWYFSLWTS